MNKTPTNIRLDLLGWTYELYQNKPDYDNYDLIQDNLEDFVAVHNLWLTDTVAPIVDELFERILNQRGLVDNGDIEWLTYYFGTNADVED